jgi:hypothetical protein
MAPKSLAAPFTFAARQIDFSNDSPSEQVGIIGRLDLSHKLVSGRSAKSVVTTLKFEVGVANSRSQHANERKTARTLRTADIPHFHTTILEMNGKHCAPL